jgi:CheY-like chemotaxis protein/HPt (histidine-containing phosphotransfer) domain-containing protein
MFPLNTQNDLPEVLLIDDDLVSREVTATLLTMTGYSVHTADSGEEAVRMIAAGSIKPGVFLIDAQMPGLSGAELIRQLRAGSQAVIFVISASQPPSDVASAADGFLLKPFDVETLHKLIQSRMPQPQPSSLDANDPVVNMEVLAQFRKMMPETAVRQIYKAVVVDLGKRIDALTNAIAKGDAAEVRRIGHAIKGGCGMAGAVQAAHLGAMLEAAQPVAEDNQLDNSAALLRDLRAAAQGLERMLDSELPA